MSREGEKGVGAVLNARDAVDLLGTSLIGRFITTEAVGSYPGGRAKVVELEPDAAAREIVMNVRHPSWRHDKGRGSDIIGIFEWEDIRL